MFQASSLASKLRKTVCQRKQLSEILFDDKTRTTSKVAHYDDLNTLRIPASTEAVDVKVTLTFGENLFFNSENIIAGVPVEAYWDNVGLN